MLMFSAVALTAGCKNSQLSDKDEPANRVILVGAWRAKILFRTGPLAGMEDLEFLYAYNAGGTMTESSNYDEAANSSPPAYGIWKAISPQTFQTKYLFYTTKEKAQGDGTRSTDWWPAGRGVLTETITLTANGQAYASTIKLESYDSTGALTDSGEGTGAGTRVVFQAADER